MGTLEDKGLLKKEIMEKRKDKGRTWGREVAYRVNEIYIYRVGYREKGVSLKKDITEMAIRRRRKYMKVKNRKDRNIIQYSVKDRKEIGRRVEPKGCRGDDLGIKKRKG